MYCGKESADKWLMITEDCGWDFKAFQMIYYTFFILGMMYRGAPKMWTCLEKNNASVNSKHQHPPRADPQGIF